MSETEKKPIRKVCCGLCEDDDCVLDDSLLCQTCRIVIRHRAHHKQAEKNLQRLKLLVQERNNG